MSKPFRTVQTIVTRIDRMTSSSNGNPRYSIETEHGSFSTEPDGQLGYSITNHLRPVGEPISIPATLVVQDSPRGAHAYVQGITTERGTDGRSAQ